MKKTKGDSEAKKSVSNLFTFVYIVSVSLMLFLFESSIYHFIFSKIFSQHQKLYWIIIPCLTYALCLFIKRFFENKQVNNSIETCNLLALVIFFVDVMNECFSVWYLSNYSVISFVIVFVCIIGIIIFKNKVLSSDLQSDDENTKKLFNLFYLNTSKAHEIAMLIDNKIIKNIESEHINESSRKSNTTLSFGKKDFISSETGLYADEMSKQRVFESFDVKQTKSIMLRKIYDTIPTSTNNEKVLETGRLVRFENVELQQLNIDDTVMILNVLQDSKLKNQKSDDIEINLNKMIEKMLDDFTIDYMFNYPPSKEDDNSKYIIRLPYKATSNFENGYQHNDLQLGKLSIIGIYRGEIDFSKKDSVSSKFLDLLSKAYNVQTQKNTENKMKLSYTGGDTKNVEFNFNHKQLNQKLKLIDVIAIIQDISFNEGEI